MSENVNNEEIDEKSVSSDNSQELLNLIESIQTKLNCESNNKDNNLEENNDLNTPNDFNKTDNFNNTKNLDNNKNVNNENFDLSNIASLLQNVDLSSIFNMFSTNKSDSNTSDNQDFFSNSIFSEIKPSTILKFQRVIASMNKSDPKKNLLLSLKPFLRKSRQDKLNEYITMLTIANAIEIFGSKGSDE